MNTFSIRQHIESLVGLGFVAVLGLLALGWLADVATGQYAPAGTGFFELRVRLFRGVPYWILSVLVLLALHAAVLIRHALLWARLEMPWGGPAWRRRAFQVEIPLPILHAIGVDTLTCVALVFGYIVTRNHWEWWC